MGDNPSDTTLWVKKKTRERLRKLAAKGESWDYLLNRIADVYEKTLKQLEARA